MYPGSCDGEDGDMPMGLLQEIFDHPRLGPALIVALSLSALAAALASQYWGGLPPCVLCIYQRYAWRVSLS